MKFGVLTLQNVAWSAFEKQWRDLEELGVETVWLADHLGDWRNLANPWLDGWSCLAALATGTMRVRLGPLVTPIAFRNPVAVAKAAITVDEISGGRLELGVGAGVASDNELAGVESWEPEERLRRFEEFVVALVAHLPGSLRPEPVQPAIPLTIAGQAQASLRLAARHAHRWITYAGSGLQPDEGARLTRERNDRLDALCAKLGRDPRTLVRSMLVHDFNVGETPFRSEADFHALVARWQKAGMDELIFYYPPTYGMPAGSVEPGLFERMLGKG